MTMKPARFILFILTASGELIPWGDEDAFTTLLKALAYIDFAKLEPMYSHEKEWRVVRYALTKNGNPPVPVRMWDQTGKLIWRA